MRRGFGRKHAEVEAVVDDDDEAAQKREADKRARRGTKELLLTFNIIDRNGNGQLSRAELLDAVQHDPSVAKLLGLPKGSDKTRCATKKVLARNPTHPHARLCRLPILRTGSDKTRCVRGMPVWPATGKWADVAAICLDMCVAHVCIDL